MDQFNKDILKNLYIPSPNSHKGQNGKLMVIGGSHLFHAASLWALTVASRIVDMVFYSSVPENNQIVHELKKEFRNGIVVSRDAIDNYMQEADAVLIGPGMLRNEKVKMKNEKLPFKMENISTINSLADEGEQSYFLTQYLLEKYPQKKWVIDAGALQMLEPKWLEKLHGQVVLTPHPLELERLLGKESSIIAPFPYKGEGWGEGEKGGDQKELQDEDLIDQVREFTKTYNCIILLKGREDLVCSPEQCVTVSGGNAGMTKGGTGDVLAGLVAALACNNDLFLAATAGSYINKKAGERLFEKMGYYFNASDLADEVPKVMRDLIANVSE